MQGLSDNKQTGLIILKTCQVTHRNMTIGKDTVYNRHVFSLSLNMT